MHSEIKTPAKESNELELPQLIDRHSSFLEDDLALSSSTHDSFIENKNVAAQSNEKSHDDTSATDYTDVLVEPTHFTEHTEVVYVSEDANDCNYDESSSQQLVIHQKQEEQQSQEQKQQQQILTSFAIAADEDNPSSPELFDDDEADDEAESSASTYPQATLEEPPTQTSPEKLSSTEMILRADKYLRRRINKFLSGVPPPPNHTIMQKDCNDFLTSIQQNRSYFWADPFEVSNGQIELLDDSGVSSAMQNSISEKIEFNNSDDLNKPNSNPDIVKNLSSTFEACEKFSQLKVDLLESCSKDTESLGNISSLTLSDTLFDSSLLPNSSLTFTDEKISCNLNNIKNVPTLYTSIKVEEVMNLPWPQVYEHKCLDIYFNRNKMVEEFENLRLKLCDRYIGNETQSTCNVFCAPQAPGSARKRLLARRCNGQSPGKRLSYLARRRKTFSSANLQGLNAVEKKLTLNIKKMQGRRGKSPKVKQGRTKTPKSSGKKRQMRRLMLEGPSPRRRIDIPKRALFQSPPTEKLVSSRINIQSTITFNNDPKKVKRALFPTPTKNKEGDASTNAIESRKRKNDEPLENPRQKWAKSLSFDCPRTLNNNSTTTCNPVRHSTGSLSQKETSTYSGRKELSEIHRKKLYWAVWEALKINGIEKSHPMFKQYATTLARTVRKHMPDLDSKYLPRKPGSTSDRMLKLAKLHCILIVESTPTL